MRPFVNAAALTPGTFNSRICAAIVFVSSGRPLTMTGGRSRVSIREMIWRSFCAVRMTEAAITALVRHAMLDLFTSWLEKVGSNGGQDDRTEAFGAQVKG